MRGKSPIAPPKWADRFFKWYCNEELYETILGDLHENYQEQYEKKGPVKSNFSYWINVFRFISRHTLQRDTRRQPQYTNQLAMFKNYFLVSVRNLSRNKAYAAINIVGLAIGLASCLILFLYVNQQLSFDQFHTNHERLYRVTNTFERSSGSIFWARTPPALAPSIRSTIAGIEKVTRLRYADDHTYAVGNRIFNQGNVFYADSVFLQVFDFQLRSGDRRTALANPNAVVITEQMASKYFGDRDPMGEIIIFDDHLSLLVTGVLEPIPVNSHITFDMLISFETFRVPDGYLADLNSWSWAGFHTYAQLASDADPEAINEEIVALYNQNINRANITTSTELQPLSSIYLESGKYTNVGESIRTGNTSTIYGLLVVAILILVIAALNFMNLSTALSLGRGKEIGIRKVMGAVKHRIMTQFLVESVTICFLALTVAFGLIAISRTYFEMQLGIEIPTVSEFVYLLPIVFAGACLVGILSGMYPSLVIAAFSPIVALKGNLKTSGKGVLFRNGLMVFQFVISLVLIAGSIVIVSQMSFLQQASLGFEQENLLKLKVLREDMAAHYTSLKNAFEQHPEVRNVAMTSHGLDGGAASGPARFPGAPEDQSYQLAYYQTDHDFLEVTGIELIEGRFFSKAYVSDSTAMLLNEKAVKMLELEHPIGAKLEFSRAERTVIGVVKDFHFNSLHVDIGPMAILMPFTNTETILVKLAPGNVANALEKLESDWKSIVGTAPFDVSFLDDSIQEMYEQEQKLSSLINLFSALAILLACLGLYGLTAFTVGAKLKEVGIRKVLGASVMELLLVLSRRFILLILIAVLLAVPLIYYFGGQWLESFAYRVEMPWWIYASSAGILLIIALSTISHQTIGAALTNPSDVLRDE